MHVGRAVVHYITEATAVELSSAFRTVVCRMPFQCQLKKYIILDEKKIPDII